jgi:hypothetical protein
MEFVDERGFPAIIRAFDDDEFGWHGCCMVCRNGVTGWMFGR